MTTIRDKLKAEAADLRARAAEIEAKLEAAEPTAAAILEHDVDAVVSFFRAFGEHLFARKAAAPAATSVPTPATAAAPGAQA